MTNNNKFVTLEEIAQIISDNNNFVICGHINPDADCIGSQVMVSLLLDSLNKNHVNLLANTNVVNDELMFLANTNKFKKSSDHNTKTDNFCFLQLDVSDDDRMGDFASKLKENAKITITIDHHITKNPCSNYTYFDEKAAATAVLIWKLFKIFDIKPSKAVSMAGYAALMGDTGSFRQQNTNAEALLFASEMVATGAEPNTISNRLFMNKSIASILLQKTLLSNLVFSNDKKCLIGKFDYKDFNSAKATKHDTEGFIDILRSVKNVEVCCLMTQEKKDGPIKVSIRSKNDLDVNSFSNMFGGGGHKGAAGFIIEGKNMEDAISIVRQALSRYMQTNK